ncbi:MAG: hypothetical protein A4E67_02243 [Syntrophaceae bacterium PtaB.Bin038]|jgi:hypothetical protein|nr:MAG: hypothetical protein A4E67_02243 [Syntrophaceae bacterium PtaB.Bin038]
MRRSLIGGILFLAFCAVLAACAAGGGDSRPEDALSLYVTAYLEGRYEDAWRLLSSEDRGVKSLEAWLDERKDSGTFLARNLHRLIGHEVLEFTRVDENHARATVEIRIPDFRVVVGEVSGAMEAATWPAGALENVSFVRRNVGAFEQKYQTQGIPKRTIRETVLLVREDGQWRVRAGLRERK